LLEENAMPGKPAFDEVMIVNPTEPGVYQGVRLMRFYPGNAATMGYYAEPPETYAGYYAEMPEPYAGYYAQTPEPYGYYAEMPEPYGAYAEPPETYGYYAQVPEQYGHYAEPPDPYGYYAEPPDMYGYYAEAPDMYGYYAEAPDMYGYYAEPPYMEGWGEPEVYGELDPTYGGYAEYEPLQAYPGMGYYSEPYPLEAYGQAPFGHFAQPDVYPTMGHYGEMPEMPGYAEYESQQAYPGVSYYGDPYLAGYVRETPPTWNAGCPMPTNVAGFSEAEPLEGYVKPSTVNASCEQMTPQPGPAPSTPDNFRPLW
jgi:hypothetical protein